MVLVIVSCQCFTAGERNFLSISLYHDAPLTQWLLDIYKFNLSEVVAFHSGTVTCSV